MSYQSDSFALLEEYEIFDFASIFVAIGGSMGLFLGFSLYQSGSELLDATVQRLEKFRENAFSRRTKGKDPIHTKVGR